MASSKIPEKFLDLLTTKKPLASIATIMPDGTPQVTPVWFDYTNGKIRINTARGRVKAKNMKVGSKVALAIVDPENAYRYIGIRGPVVEEDEKNADAHIDSLAKKYLNQDKYPFRSPGEQRVTYVIEPQSVHGQG
jgi:PPOX class probable F420-dependent enzyme